MKNYQFFISEQEVRFADSVPAAQSLRAEKQAWRNMYGSIN